MQPTEPIGLRSNGTLAFEVGLMADALLQAPARRLMLTVNAARSHKERGRFFVEDDEMGNFHQSGFLMNNALATNFLILLTTTITIVQLISFRVWQFDLESRLGMVPISKMGYQWWRPLTANLVHSYGFIHLVANMVALALSGPIVEQVYGRERFLIIYCVSGYIAWSICALLGRRGGGGASAAVVGVVAAMCLITIPQMNANEEMKELAIRALEISLVYFSSGFIVNWLRKMKGLGKISIGDDVHLVGFIAGIALSLILCK